MSPETRKQFNTLTAKQILDSPEGLEIVEMLLALYHAKCSTEKLQEEMLQSLLDRIYGRKSEKSKYHPEQAIMFPELLEELIGEWTGDADDEPIDASEPEVEEAQDDDVNKSSVDKPRRKGAHGRSKIPPHIERCVVERIDVDAPNCETCGVERPIIRIEKSERLEYVPPKVIAEVTERVIRGPLPCECDANALKIVRPELPIRPIDRGMPGVNMILSVIIGKFLYHLPHYRQVTKTLKDAGINLSKQTVWDWTRRAAELLEPLWELMRKKLIEQDHLAADETTAKMVQRDKPGSPTKTTWMWQYFGFDDSEAPYTVFDFAMTRAHDAPKAFLGDFHGVLLTDGHSAYNVLDNITHAGCMAHARRKFDEALITSPMIAAQAIGLIAKLYKIEDVCMSMTPDDRREYRQYYSSGLMLRLRLFLEQERSNVLPQSLIGKAITYTLNQWDALCRFVDDGVLPIDNNAVEREMKSIATGRKNWLFFGSPRGGHAAAIIYSIIASARRHDLDVWEYLGDILRRLANLNPGELERLLPDAWKRDRESKLAVDDSSSTKRVA
jgi:transposase